MQDSSIEGPILGLGHLPHWRAQVETLRGPIISHGFVLVEQVKRVGVIVIGEIIPSHCEVTF